MKKLKFIIIFFLLKQFSYSQIGDTIGFDSDTMQKMIKLCDSLQGDWLLKNKVTISKDKKDTTNQITSMKSKIWTLNERPIIEISFKKNGDVVITETPLGKSKNVTKAKWKLEVRPFTDIDLFFIEIDNSNNDKVVKEFNGFITELVRNHCKISNDVFSL